MNLLRRMVRRSISGSNPSRKRSSDDFSAFAETVTPPTSGSGEESLPDLGANGWRPNPSPGLRRASGGRSEAERAPNSGAPEREARFPASGELDRVLMRPHDRGGTDLGQAERSPTEASSPRGLGLETDEPPAGTHERMYVAQERDRRRQCAWLMSYSVTRCRMVPLGPRRSR